MRLSSIILATVALVAAPLAPSVTAGERIVACAGDALTTRAAAVAAAEQAFAATWLVQAPNWFAAFESRPPKRSPFDTSPEPDGPAEPVKGHIWAQGLYCIANASPTKDEVLVRFYARVAAFHEGQGWSRPFTDGLVGAYLMTPDGGGWRATPVARERTILLPTALRTRPAAEDLPARDVATGLPCSTGRYWNGARCAAAR